MSTVVPAPGFSRELSMEGNGGHLLIVEDEDFILEMVEKWVKDNTNYRVTCVTRADEALKRFEELRPDVVLSDIRMPGMSGQELLAEVKRIDPSIPFILMSGHGDIVDTIKALRSGALDFFQKPFKMGSLMASIDRAFHLIDSRRFRKMVNTYLVDEHRHFQIPNDLDLVPHLISELIGFLEHDPALDHAALEGIRAALHEMIVNAIEHGNLGITYEEKSALMESPHGWWKEVEKRSKIEPYRGRKVSVELHNAPEALRFVIQDEGQGFDHANLPDPTTAGHLLHGRGVLIARVHMDEVQYNPDGNRVTLIKKKKLSPAPAAT